MGDLIRRCDVLDNINKRIYYFDKASLDEARNAVHNAPAVDAMPRWISVEERLPEDYEDVVIIMRNGASSWYRVAYREYGGWSFGGGRRVHDEVTHYMHLPEPPKEAP